MQYKKQHWALIFAVASIALVFVFQNCAQKGSGDFSSKGTTTTIYSLGTTTTVPGGEAATTVIYEMARVGATGDNPRYDYMLSPNSTEASGAGYTMTDGYFRIYVNPTASRIPIYRCVIEYNGGDPKGPYSHFFAKTSNCDGVPGAKNDTPSGAPYILGYVEISPVGAAQTGLVRCYHAGLDRYRHSGSAASCGSYTGFTAKDVLGYVEYVSVVLNPQIPSGFTP